MARVISPAGLLSVFDVAIAKVEILRDATAQENIGAPVSTEINDALILITNASTRFKAAYLGLNTEPTQLTSEEQSLSELRQEAKKLDISGRSSMNKDELQKAIDDQNDG